jgi:GDPmannose 4,6-dehydratase
MLRRDDVEVVGLVKPGTDISEFRRYVPDAQVVECDLVDDARLRELVIDAQPNRIFNFGGISSIMESVRNPELTEQVNVSAVEAIVDAMRVLRLKTGVTPHLVAAASGTIFEGVDRAPQNESMEPEPRSPYAQSKAKVISLLRSLRQDEGLFTTSAILYNHESPLRGTGFVTRKITMAAARIAAGVQDRLELGDIEVARDWGWAPDYVQGMRLMLESDQPRDYVLATGISHRLSFFIARAFEAAGLPEWQRYVTSTSDNTRPIDTNLLVGDSRAAYRELGWRHTVDFDSIARKMVAHDMTLLREPDAIWRDF